MLCRVILLVNYELGSPSNTGTEKTSYWTHEPKSRQVKTLTEEAKHKTQRAQSTGSREKSPHRRDGQDLLVQRDGYFVAYGTGGEGEGLTPLMNTRSQCVRPWHRQSTVD